VSDCAVWWVSDGHLTDTSVTFEAVQFFERSRSLQLRILGFAFRFPYLHLFSGLMLGEGNDLAHVCGSPVVGGRVVLADCTQQTHTHPAGSVRNRGIGTTGTQC
jgi:hypothetical protein